MGIRFLFFLLNIMGVMILVGRDVVVKVIPEYSR